MEVVDAAGKLILPGGVDVHTHFDLPMFGTVSSDDHYTGHKAAAFGGTTTVIDFVPQDLSPLQANVDAWHAKADPKAAIDFGFHMNITRFDEAVAEQIPGLPDAGITTLKVFTAYNNRLRLQDGEIFQVMRIARENGMLTMLHAENGDVIDLLVAEALAAGHTHPGMARPHPPGLGRGGSRPARCRPGGPGRGAAVHRPHERRRRGGSAAYARQHGLPVMGETCPQYLFFTIDDLRRPDGAKWVCSPPMRTAADNARLWEGLARRDHPDGRHRSLPVLLRWHPARSCMKDSRWRSPAKSWGKTTSPRSPTACPGSATGCRSCGPTAWAPAGSPRTSLWP